MISNKDVFAQASERAAFALGHWNELDASSNGPTRSSFFILIFIIVGILVCLRRHHNAETSRNRRRATNLFLGIEFESSAAMPSTSAALDPSANPLSKNIALIANHISAKTHSKNLRPNLHRSRNALPHVKNNALDKSAKKWQGSLEKPTGDATANPQITNSALQKKIKGHKGFLRSLGQNEASFVSPTFLSKQDFVSLHLGTLPDYPDTKAIADGLVTDCRSVGGSPEKFMVHIELGTPSSEEASYLMTYLDSLMGKGHYRKIPPPRHA